jgi:hypothetical protein
VIGGVLTQEEGSREFVVAYISRRQTDIETRYEFVEKLCLLLYYACTKFRHYILSSTCTVVCQHDIVKFMLQKPMLRGRVGKWIYSMIEYDLLYESLRAIKGQVMADFIVDHMVSEEGEVSLIEISPWLLYFDGSVCGKGQGIGCVLVSPLGTRFRLAVRLEFPCTSKVGLAQLVRFLVVELTHPGSNPRFDMGVAFTANYSFSGRRSSTARCSW